MWDGSPDLSGARVSAAWREIRGRRKTQRGLIYGALKKTGGSTGGDALIAAMKGMAWESPRGPVSIDPETRDIVQNVHMRKVEKVDGELYNVEFETFPAVKDPGKIRK
jgi:branched-chain amino acid transport system substrate-binding protein